MNQPWLENIMRAVEAVVAVAVAEEREACAKVAEKAMELDLTIWCGEVNGAVVDEKQIAAAIRERK